MLRLTFLGTGTSQGVPMIGCPCEVCHSTDKHDKRLRSSVMIEHFPGTASATNSPDTRLIIDAGPDFRYQMLRGNIDAIDAILLTHGHKDHTGGIDDVRAFNYFQEKSIPIYAPEEAADTVRKDFDYAFAEFRYPGAPEIELHTAEAGVGFKIGALEILPIQGLHYKLPVLGYRVGQIAYLTDFNKIEEDAINAIKGVEVLVINALRHEKHISHFNVAEAIEVSRKIGAKKTYLTHMSHQIGLYANVKNELPEGIEYAYDGLKIEI